jgi:predicted nucleic acid-binding protein
MIEKFDNKAIYLDTAPLIYYLEENPSYTSFLKKLFKKNENGDFTFYTSTITLTEVLTLPFRLDNKKLIKQYEHFLLGSSTLNLISVNEGIAKLSAKLRAEYNFRLPDAIHLATALEVKVDFFLTNDLSLNKVKGLKVITPIHG